MIDVSATNPQSLDGNRLAYALHLAAKVHGLTIPVATVDVPDGWTP